MIERVSAVIGRLSEGRSPIRAIVRFERSHAALHGYLNIIETEKNCFGWKKRLLIHDSDIYLLFIDDNHFVYYLFYNAFNEGCTNNHVMQ